jgi:predicted AAA+ superfamily ATPase
MAQKSELQLLTRIAEALERLTPPAPALPDLKSFEGFQWKQTQNHHGYLAPVQRINRVELGLLKGIDLVKAQLLENTERFAGALPANNALLWGARGMGKSSLVKALHHHVAQRIKSLKIVEIHREDINSLPQLMQLLDAQKKFRFIVYCDDLSFDSQDTSYKSLKAALDGGLEGRPTNVVFYATSNRRHLLPRDMIENERSTAINPSEAVQEKVSLSDRFGLWLGFHSCTQDEFFEMLDGYARHLKLDITAEDLHAKAIEWSVTRGSRSGRVAWQFITDLAGRMGKTV